MTNDVPTYSEVLNAFSPAKEINSPEKFAGRDDQIKHIYRSLLTEGTNIAIVGNRGIGKISLERQAEQIAQGNNEVVEQFGGNFSQKLGFLTVYFACGNDVLSIEDLIERLLTHSNCFKSWINDMPAARKTIESIKPELSARIFGVDA